MSPDDARLLRRYRTKRLQRAIEYVSLSALFLYFLITFYEYYRPLFVVTLFVLFLVLNLRLTTIREARRATADRRVRLTADIVESILFLLLILAFSFPTITRGIFGSTPHEHYGLVAATLLGMFIGGLSGEVWFQTRRLPAYDGRHQVAYMQNLKRTIILPYMRERIDI
jgi:hypothetical protein